MAIWFDWRVKWSSRLSVQLFWNISYSLQVANGDWTTSNVTNDNRMIKRSLIMTYLSMLLYHKTAYPAECCTDSL